MSLHRPLSRLAVVLAVLAGLLATGTGAASAHVSVSSPDAAPGGFGKLVFRVPNESDTASTVALRIQIPEESAMASLRVQPVPGWTATLTTAELDEPIESHGQEITSYVSVVEFRADEGGGIGPGEFQEFALSGGPFPEAERIAFPTVQGYSDGSEAAWIEPTVDGAEPDNPAPVLALAESAAPVTAAGPSEAAAAEHAAPEVAEASLGALALVVAILALLVAATAAVLGRRATRRTVSS